MRTKNKKGAVDLTGIAIAVIVLGITATIGAVVTHNIATTQITSTSVIRVNNETTSNNVTGTTVAHTKLQWVDSATDVLKVYGASNATDCTGNYSVTVSEGISTLAYSGANSNGCNGTYLNITYNRYNISDPRFDVAEKATTGIGEYGSWFKILVIIGIAALILGLIYTAFRGQSGSGNATY